MSKEEELEQYVEILKNKLNLPDMHLSVNSGGRVVKYAIMLNLGDYLLSRGHVEIDVLLDRVYGFNEAVNFMEVRNWRNN